MAMTDPTYRPDTDEHREAVEQARAALLDPAVGHMVDMVLRADGDVYEAASADGHVRFRATADGNGWAVEVVEERGANPIADQRTDHLVGIEAERATPNPVRGDNAYPHAYDQIVQIFDAPAAPDLIAIHSAAHDWTDQGGHRGEHGSHGIVQARAPFVIAGAGVAGRGMVPESCRLVDIAPTVMALLGAEPGRGVAANGTERDDAFLHRQDGEVVTSVLDPRGGHPDHVVGFLMDGANANVLHDLVGRGELPNIARLMAMGTTLGHGAMSCTPTVTLANHTSILTGAYPGHHGILHNAWWDRARGEQVITNSPAHWMTSMQHLDPGVETLFQAVDRAFPGSTVVSCNEPCDTGAHHSVFDQMRIGEEIDAPPRPEELPHSTQRYVRPNKEYRWASIVDFHSVRQFEAIWGGEYRGRSWDLPRFTWVNFSLTDEASHEGGPYSEIAASAFRDTDARIGAVLEAVERAGVWDRTAFFLTADHGMQETDPACTGNWAEALDASGVAYRDEGYGFIYVNP
jgi:hypothetical protein